MTSKLVKPTDEENALLTAAMKDDPDTFELTEEFFKNGVKGINGLATLVGEDAVAFLRPRGRPKGTTKGNTKRVVSLSLDIDLVERLRATGKGWQTRANAALRAAFVDTASL